MTTPTMDNERRAALAHAAACVAGYRTLRKHLGVYTARAVAAIEAVAAAIDDADAAAAIAAAYAAIDDADADAAVR